MVELLSLSRVPPDDVERLLDDAFGYDRHGRTAYKLRDGSDAIAPLSFGLVEGNGLVGSIQCWPVRVNDTAMVLVGPVAVLPKIQGTGLGKTLMWATLNAAPNLGDPPMVMIGDPEYYGRFGFSADATGGWTLPGPWEPRRLLARNIGNHPLPKHGMLERSSHAL